MMQPSCLAREGSSCESVTQTIFLKTQSSGESILSRSLESCGPARAAIDMVLVVAEMVQLKANLRWKRKSSVERNFTVREDDWA